MVAPRLYFKYALGKTVLLGLAARGIWKKKRDQSPGSSRNYTGFPSLSLYLHNLHNINV